MRQNRFARSGFTLNQKRALQRDCGIHRHFQVLSGDIIVGAFKSSHEILFRFPHLVWIGARRASDSVERLQLNFS